MDTGVLILLNLSTVPFWSEFDQITSKNGGRATLFSVFQLRDFRRTRWAWGFGVLWLLFLALALAPSASGRSYPSSEGLVVTICLLQIAVGIVAVRRAVKFRVK